MRVLSTMRARLVTIIAVFVTALMVLQSWSDYQGKLDLLMVQARKTVALQYYPVKRLIDEHTTADGVAVTSQMLAPVKKEFKFNISVVVPEGGGFTYQAKTHDLSIPPKMFPWLKKVMEAKEPLFRRVSKNGKELLTYYTQMRDAGGRVVGVVAIPRDITGDLASLRADALVRLGVGVVLLVLVLGIIFLVLNRCVNRPLRDFLGFLSKASEGGYANRLPDAYSLEMGQLARGVNGLMDTVQEAMARAGQEREKALEQAGSAQQALEAVRREEERTSRMVAKMAEVAGRAGAISAELTDSSRHLADQARETAQGAETQRGRALETAKAMEEMNEAVLSVAENASRASEGAGAARDKALEGAEVVERVSRAAGEVQERTDRMKVALDELGERAEAIGQIIGVINDIADQTNLLALNAAIEAARAGDAGRGFAVVADEVRKLAEKTMQATQEVESAVSGIQTVAKENVQGMESTAEAVATSNAMSSEAGGYLNDIVDIVADTASRVEAIAAAAEEQSSTSEHITASMDEINEITGRTAQGVAGSSQAIEHVAQLAGDLRTLIAELEDSAGRKEEDSEV